jgi:hypothetical protein
MCTLTRHVNRIDGSVRDVPSGHGVDAIGEALGAPIELDDLAAIQRRHGRLRRR